MSVAPIFAPQSRVRAFALRLWAMGAVLLLIAAVALSHPAWLRQVPHLSGDRLSEIGLPVTVVLTDRQGVLVTPAPGTAGGSAAITRHRRAHPSGWPCAGRAVPARCGPCAARAGPARRPCPEPMTI